MLAEGAGIACARVSGARSRRTRPAQPRGAVGRKDRGPQMGRPEGTGPLTGSDDARTIVAPRLAPACRNSGLVPRFLSDDPSIGTRAAGRAYSMDSGFARPAVDHAGGDLRHRLAPDPGHRRRSLVEDSGKGRQTAGHRSESGGHQRDHAAGRPMRSKPYDRGLDLDEQLLSRAGIARSCAGGRRAADQDRRLRAGIPGKHRNHPFCSMGPSSGYPQARLSEQLRWQLAELSRRLHHQGERGLDRRLEQHR